MAPFNKKRSTGDAFPSKSKSPRTSSASAGPSKPPFKSSNPKSKSNPERESHAAPRPAPSFTSALRDEETDFPRGGGSSLTALEMKQVREEGRREAEAEERAEAGLGTKRKRPVSEREARRLKKNEVKPGKEHEEGEIRVEELNYKRLVPGTRLLTRIHTVLPLHLILSLPNNLLAHVPITEISSTLTTLLSSEEAMSEDDDEDENDDEVSSSSGNRAPDLSELFVPGQYFPAKVLNLYPTASQSFISQYPVTETTRLAARVEMTLMPEKVHSEVAKPELEKGYTLVGEVRSEEDKGWRIGLGLNEAEGMKGVEGWVSREDVEKRIPSKTLTVSQLLPATISSLGAGGRVVNLTLDPTERTRAQLSEVSNVGSLLPGHQVSALVTAVVPSGLNVKLCGFFDGTIELTHLGLAGQDIDEKFKVGKKIRARIIYDNLSTTPRRFALSVLPHILDLTSLTVGEKKIPVEQALPIGKVLQTVTVVRVISEWGVICRTDDGLEGFVHISHISDERIPALSSSTGQFKTGTLHRARVIGHSPLDGMLLLSFEQKVLDQVFMNVDELRVGQALKGTIHRLTDKALFVNIQGSVDGVVWPLHYADIRLKHPEKRFKVGGSVKARIFALEPARGRVILTLKKSLVESSLETPGSFADVRTGMVTGAVVSKILDKGCIVDLFGGLRAFVPQSEASQNFISNLSDIFYVGKPVTVRITELHTDTQRLVASVRQALPTAIAAEKLEVGDAVKGLVAQIHAEQVVVSLAPSQLTALLSLSNLSNHRHMGVDELRASLKIGESLEDLVVVSKNPTSGLLIVANKRSPTKTSAATTAGSSGVSSRALNFDSIQVGQLIPGKAVSHTPQGTVIQLPNMLRGRVHPTDACDDLSLIAEGDGPLNIDDDVTCYVLKVNSHSRIIDLSTRKSRTSPSTAGAVVDPEIGGIDELKVGQAVRGLVKNVSPHGLFVALGRTATARVMIKEMFDEFVKDWQSRFEVNQLVSGKILSIDEKKGLVEMTLRKNTGKGAKKVAQLGLSEFSDGQKVDAIVKKVEAYGMFLQIEGSDVRGLCHKSEISDNKAQDVSAALKGFREGDKVKAKIVGIDREKGKISFGVKASYFDDEDFGGEAVDMNGDEEEQDGEMDEDEDEEEDDVEGQEDSEEEDDLTFEDGDEDEDEDEDDEDDVTIEVSNPSAPSKVAAAPKPKKRATAPASTLELNAGFDWTGAAADSGESDSESDSEDDTAPSAAITSQSKSKSKGKTRAVEDLTATAPEAQPESSADFERALLASPNSSFLWIQYMSFLLQLHEIDKARKLGRQALEKIAYREEEEKLNVWMALVNLELGFGTEESAEKTFKEAAQYNDARTVYTRYADALAAAGKDEMVEETYKKILKKFSAYPDSWTRFAEFYLKKGDLDAARALLPRSLKSLDKSKHVETIEKMAILEFRHGEAERGKTLFEGLMDRHPRRLDLWSVYIDQLAKTGDIQGVRGLFDRALGQKLTAKKAKFLFKKWLNIEIRIGDVQGQEKAKEKAREWVVANAKPEEGADGSEDEDDE